MEMTVSNGRGYVRSEDNKKIHDIKKAGVIAIDSLYSPIERVSYEVANARVGQDESYDKLILDVWTNGSMKPEEAVALASRIIIEHFEILTKLDEIADETGLMKQNVDDSKTKALEMSIDELEFSVRTCAWNNSNSNSSDQKIPSRATPISTFDTSKSFNVIADVNKGNNWSMEINNETAFYSSINNIWKTSSFSFFYPCI